MRVGTPESRWDLRAEGRKQRRGVEWQEDRHKGPFHTLGPPASAGSCPGAAEETALSGPE